MPVVVVDVDDRDLLLARAADQLRDGVDDVGHARGELSASSCSYGFSTSTTISAVCDSAASGTQREVPAAHRHIDIAAGCKRRILDRASVLRVAGWIEHPHTPLDRALRLDTEMMLVDDPVKRVDHMTMALGRKPHIPFLDQRLAEGGLRSRLARDHGLFRREHAHRLLAEPNRHLTALSGSKLWQLGALEMRLQAHGI